MNRFIGTGNLTRDIELKKTQTNKTFCNFTIAINEGEKTLFLDCQAWEKTAELMDRFVGKGSKVLVEGRLTSYERDTLSGKERRTYVVADRVEFLNLERKQGPMVTADIPNEGIAKRENSHVYMADVNEDDLPFI